MTKGKTKGQSVICVTLDILCEQLLEQSTSLRCRRWLSVEGLGSVLYKYTDRSFSVPCFRVQGYTHYTIVCHEYT